MNIKMLLFDIDGVITDGRKYADGQGAEFKSISLKDLDAIGMLKDAGYRIGCVSGEETSFSNQVAHISSLDYARIGYKKKLDALEEVKRKYQITPAEICYIGDGKYDIPMLEAVGLSLCPGDAIEEVKRVSDVVLKRKGGEGCVAEAYTVLLALEKRQAADRGEISSVVMERLMEHRNILDVILNSRPYVGQIETAVKLIIESYANKGRLFLCGNGGSAADAQHLAAELVGRFYLERRALSAEALTVNTSILTSLANDYDYNLIFSRQLEAKAVAGDALIGITTSGTSENVLRAFQKAKELQMKTILMTGDISEAAVILAYTDCLLAVASQNTPRIQEIHILTGHIICEIVEREIAG